MRRPAKIAIVIGAVAALQAIAILGYRALQRSRAAPSATARFEIERLAGSGLAPALSGKRADGTSIAMRWPSSRVSIIHFWATWCVPCRKELPSLLARASELRAHDIDIIAIAVDDQWADIRTFFGGAIPPEIVMPDDPTAHKRFGASTLPDTYVVDRDGRMVERYHGARDWHSSSARDHLLTLMR